MGGTGDTIARREALIRFEGIGKNFGRVRALNDIDFTFMQGECVGIAGHNGAGKSTLTAVLAGVHAPTQGRIEVEGKDAPHYDANAARDAGVRCVFQELSLCANLTVAENMCIVHPQLRGRGWRRTATKLMREKAVRRIPIEEDGKPIGIISIGDVAMEKNQASVLADISGAAANN